MSSKEIKGILKEVKEAIKAKDNATVISKCEQILKKEPDNYMALIFLGAAYQETDKKEAAKHLRKASKCSNEPSVALQGLANCAEVEELPDVYRQLLHLVPNKYIDYHTRIVNVAANESVWEQCINILATETETADSERVKSARLKICSILCNQKSVPEKYNDLFTTCLEFSISNEENENSLQYYKRYLKQLHKLNRKEELLAKAKQMAEKYPSEIYPLEWICKLYTENFEDENHNVFNSNIEENIEKLLKISQNSSLGKLAKAVNLYLREQYVACRDLLLKFGKEQVDRNMHSRILAKCYIKLEAYELAESVLKELGDVKNIDFLQCLASKEDDDGLNDAVALATELLCSNKSQENIILESLIKCNIRIGKTDVAKEYLDRIREGDLLKCMQAQFFQKPKEAIQTLLTIEASSFRKNFLLGVKYCEAGDYEKSLLSLAYATREQPYNSNCFFWLAQVYVAINNDDSAKKCFEKCFNLNPRNKRAICHLILIYKKSEQWDTSYQILEKALTYFTGSQRKWIQFRLGQHHLNARNADEAINCFRSAVRLDINDIKSWEGLADAYQLRGSYNSALKVYQKILELEDNNAYAKLQIGIIKTTLKSFTEAVECFDDLLTQYPEYLPGLKGSAECHYLLALKLQKQKLIGRCKDHLQKATNFLQRAILIMKQNYVCIWRLIANVFVLVACLPKSKAHLEVLGKLAGQEEDTIKLEKEELFELAARFYVYAIKASENDPFLWHELSLCYYHYSRKYGKDANKNVEWLKLARDASKKAIKLQPTRWQNWNLLGVIFATQGLKNLALAQHCFVKALELDRKSAISWTNLGVLYLTESHIELANKAFGKSQQSETNFANAWIGQGIIAERIGHHEEAMDLFRHCTQLDFHVESATGYAYWVCSVLSNPENMKDPNYKYAIENMYAVPVALDNIIWYYQSELDDSLAESMSYYGFLSLQQNHFTDAINCFKYAANKSVDEVKDKMLCNLGFAFLRNDQPSQAVETFKLITTATVQSTIGLALGFYKCKKYEDAYSAYSSALEWLASTDDEKCTILLAMAAVAYAAQGEDDAKSLLLQCIRFSKPPVQALFATCAFSILHNEPELTEAVLEALEEYENNANYAHHIAFLTSQVHLVNGQVKNGLLYLLSRIHELPDFPQIRKICVHYLMQHFTSSQKLMYAASRLAEGVLCFDLRDYKKSKNPSLDCAKSLALASNAMKYVNMHARKILAQRAVHLNPTCKEARAALKACL